jgi:hypothetical protein
MANSHGILVLGPESARKAHPAKARNLTPLVLKRLFALRGECVQIGPLVPRMNGGEPPRIRNKEHRSNGNTVFTV